MPPTCGASAWASARVPSRSGRSTAQKIGLVKAGTGSRRDRGNGGRLIAEARGPAKAAAIGHRIRACDAGPPSYGQAAPRATSIRHSRPADIEVVERVVGQLVHLDRPEAGLAEVALGGLAAPHGAQSLAALRQRHGHAVHAGHRVEQSAQRMVSVQVMVAGALHVLGEVDAVVGQRAADPAENRQGLAWSWMASKLVTKSKAAGSACSSKRLRSLAAKCALVWPSRTASALA